MTSKSRSSACWRPRNICSPRGKSFARTAYLAFGDDEETINLGALAIAEHLKAQGVTLEFVLDEGGCKIEPGTAFGAPETSIVSVQLMEKGYADLELSVHSIGGHSSRPYGGTSTWASLRCDRPTSRAHRLPCASTAP